MKCQNIWILIKSLFYQIPSCVCCLSHRVDPVQPAGGGHRAEADLITMVVRRYLRQVSLHFLFMSCLLQQNTDPPTSHPPLCSKDPPQDTSDFSVKPQTGAEWRVYWRPEIRASCLHSAVAVRADWTVITLRAVCAEQPAWCKNTLDNLPSLTSHIGIVSWSSCLKLSVFRSHLDVTDVKWHRQLMVWHFSRAVRWLELLLEWWA